MNRLITQRILVFLIGSIFSLNVKITSAQNNKRNLNVTLCVDYNLVKKIRVYEYTNLALTGGNFFENRNTVSYMGDILYDLPLGKKTQLSFGVSYFNRKMEDKYNSDLYKIYYHVTDPVLSRDLFEDRSLEMPFHLNYLFKSSKIGVGFKTSVYSFRKLTLFYTNGTTDYTKNNNSYFNVFPSVKYQHYLDKNKSGKIALTGGIDFRSPKSIDFLVGLNIQFTGMQKDR